MNYLLRDFWVGWRRWAIWLSGIGMILLLGTLRIETEAEFTFASMVLFPVLAVAWVGGKKQGLLMALLASAMWVASDISSGRTFSASWIPWTNAATHLMTYGLVAILAAQVRLLLQREQEQSSRDVLTGLYNRRHFIVAGESEVERSRRYAHPLAFAFLDLDYFKQLNDTHGHDAGDAALRATARALRASLRSNDLVARLGGDEFAILLPEIGFDEASGAGRKVFAAVHDALRIFPPAGVSIGVAWFERADRPFEEMLKVADDLMYEVKAGGKNNFCCRRLEPRPA